MAAQKASIPVGDAADPHFLAGFTRAKVRMKLSIFLFAAVMTLSGCASNQAISDACGNSVANPGDVVGSFNEDELRKMYFGLANGAKWVAKDPSVNVEELTRGTITPAGTIDVYAVVKNIGRDHARKNGIPESMREGLANNGVSVFKVSASREFVCSLQNQLTKK